MQGEVAIARRQQELVQPALMIDAAQGFGADTETDGTAKRIARQGNIAQIGQVAPARLVLRVGDIIAGLDGCSRKFATAGHWLVP